MSLLLAAALSGAGVADSADICRINSWSSPPIGSAAFYFPRLGSGYIPPFADTPEAHEQTRLASGTSAQALTAEAFEAMMTASFFRVQLCAPGIQSVQRSVRPARG
jgi:hypothetical protein